MMPQKRKIRFATALNYVKIKNKTFKAFRVFAFKRITIVHVYV